MPALPEIDAANGGAVTASMLDGIALALTRHGVCRIDGLFGPQRLHALQADLSRLNDDGALRAASTGRAGSHGLRPEIRGDSTLWLHDVRCGDAAGDFVSTLDALRIGFNRSMFLGLQDIQAHYATYPVGSGYGRHSDRLRDESPPGTGARRVRVLSWVTYLNDAWQEEDGGALRLHLTDGAVDVLPIGDTSLCFLSEIEHEVLPATRERSSIAAWFSRH